MELTLFSVAIEEKILPLWQEVFSDSKDYIRFFFDHWRDRLSGVILLDQNEAVGMILLLPCTIAPDHPAYYWYCACVRSDYRGKGHFRTLCKSALSYAQNKGRSSVCVPVPHLSGFYQKIGLNTPYYCYEKEFVAPHHQSKLLLKDSPERFLTRLAPPGSVVWDLPALRYAFAENSNSGGGNYIFREQDKDYPFTLFQTSNGLEITQTEMDFEKARLAAACIEPGLSDKIMLYRSFSPFPGGKKRLFGLTDFPFASDPATPAPAFFFPLK